MSKTKTVDSLSWNQRFALIDAYTPTDSQICDTFGVSSDELSTAREMRKAGTLTPSKDLDVNKYNGIFSTTTPASTTHSRPDATSKPETASMRAKEAKKRGRKGDKIQTAFAAIPGTPVVADQFVKQYNISMAVLRQSKRFDKTGLTGLIRVKKDKATKSLMVWREDK